MRFSSDLDLVVSDFAEDFNSQTPYHGAVSYGYFSGAVSRFYFLLIKAADPKRVISAELLR